MKTTLKFSLPSTEEIVAGLEPGAVYPRVVRAEEAATIAEAELAGARQRLAEATERAEALPGAVRRGAAVTADLHDAIDKQRAAALAVPDAEQAVTVARDSLEQTRRDAVAAVGAEAVRRAVRLQAIADELTPVLTELRALEVALIDGARSAVAGYLDAAGRPSSVAVPPLRWPVSLADQKARLAIAAQRDLVAASLSPGEFARQRGVGAGD